MSPLCAAAASGSRTNPVIGSTAATRPSLAPPGARHANHGLAAAATLREWLLCRSRGVGAVHKSGQLLVSLAGASKTRARIVSRVGGAHVTQAPNPAASSSDSADSASGRAR